MPPSRLPFPTVPASVVLVLAALSPAACGPEGPETREPESPAAEAPAPAPDSAAAAQAGPTSTDIWLATLTVRGDSVVVGTPTNLTRRPGYDNQPAFLPGGRAFLYTAIDSAGQADVWRYDLDARSARPVTRTPESEYSPTPLPDGSGFSAVRVEADSTQRLWRFDMDGSGPRVLLEDVAPVGYHAWVDDTVVALFVLGDPPTLRIADTRTGEAEVAAEGIGRSMQPIPGGGAVSFVDAGAGEGATIRRWDPDGGASALTAAASPEGDFHAWTPGGLLLQADGPRVWWWTGRDGDPWRTAADLGDLEVTRLAVHPDGTSLLLVAEPRSGGGGRP